VTRGAERDGISVVCNPAARERLGIDLHRGSTQNYTLYRSEYIDLTDRVQPAFLRNPIWVHVARRYPSVIYSLI
jgi:hypothetical protein